jgi:signal transduction histidine kinase
VLTWPRWASRRLSFHDAALLAARAGVAAVVYYAAARFGRSFLYQNSHISVIWPANAIFVAALVLAANARERLALIAAISLSHAAAMHADVETWRWAWQIVVNTAFAVCAWITLRRTGGLPLHFSSRRQVSVFIAACFALPSLLALTTPTVVRAVLGLDQTYTPLTAFLRVTLSNAGGMLLVTPVVLLWVPDGFRALAQMPLRRQLEAGAILASLLVIGGVAFGMGSRVAHVPTALLWILPPLLWATVRFGPLGAITCMFTIAALSIWGTARHLGPFVLAAQADQVLSLEVFWIVLTPPVMLLAAAIREREQAEAALHAQRNQLAHVTRVATVGELSGALAHELRQPLTSILANAQAGSRLLTQHPLDLNELRDIFVDIVQQDQQAASVVSRLRTLLKEGESNVECVAMPSVVRDAVALSRTALAMSGVTLHAQIGARVPCVQGDPVQLLQVLLNLIVNACESMSHIPESERILELRLNRKPNRRVEVTVIDAGAGLPAGGEERVFEPFFTTKAQGLGLGLAISRSIVTRHGGQLWGESNRGAGATFHLVLPAHVQH